MKSPLQTPAFQCMSAGEVLSFGLRGAGHDGNIAARVSVDDLRGRLRSFSGLGSSSNSLSASVVLKLFRFEADFTKEIETRANMLPGLVVPVLDAYTPSSSGVAGTSMVEELSRRGWQQYSYCVVMPLADTNLRDEILHERLSEEQSLDAIQQISASLRHMESLRLVYMNLHAGHVVRLGGRWMLIDFTTCTKYNTQVCLLSLELSMCTFS